MGARAVAWSQILGAGFGNPLVVDAAKFCDAFIADLTPENFSDLQIPLTLMATDLEPSALKEGMTRDEVIKALDGHAKGATSLVGMFSKQ